MALRQRLQHSDQRLHNADTALRLTIKQCASLARANADAHEQLKQAQV